MISIRNLLTLILISAMALATLTAWLMSSSSFDRQLREEVRHFEVGELARLQQETGIILRRIYILSDLVSLDLASPGPVFTRLLADLREQTTKYESSANKYIQSKEADATRSTPAARRASLTQGYSTLKTSLEVFLEALRSYALLADEYIYTARGVGDLPFQDRADELAQHEQQVIAAVSNLRAQEFAHYQAGKQEIQTRLLVMFCTTVGLFILLIWFVSHAIAQPIVQLRAEAERAEAPGEPFEPPSGKGLYAETTALRRSLANLVKSRNLEELGLEAKVARREAELAHMNGMDQLGVMAGNVAHDFSNILTVVMSYTEVSLRTDELSTSTQDNLQQVLAAADLGKSITEQLLKLSRKKLNDEQPSSIKLAAFIAEMEPLWKPLLGTSVGLEAHCEEGVPDVFIEERKLTQILMNLVTNARDAISGRGVIQIFVRNSTAADRADLKDRDDPDLGYSLIEVRDNGSGIPQGMRDKLYEPYETTKDEGKGTGFGLSIVHSMIKSAGGSVAFTTESGVGTTFRVLLPQARKPSPAPRIAPRETARFLLVEDESSLREIATMALRSAGHQVLAAEDGKVAMATWMDHQDEIDAVITDIRMPGMQGDEMVTKLRELRDELPVLFISGHSYRAVTESRDPHSATLMLEKPFTTTQLVEKVDELIRISSPA